MKKSSTTNSREHVQIKFNIKNDKHIDKVFELLQSANSLDLNSSFSKRKILNKEMFSSGRKNSVQFDENPQVRFDIQNPNRDVNSNSHPARTRYRKTKFSSAIPNSSSERFQRHSNPQKTPSYTCRDKSNNDSKRFQRYPNHQNKSTHAGQDKSTDSTSFPESRCDQSLGRSLERSRSRDRSKSRCSYSPSRCSGSQSSCEFSKVKANTFSCDNCVIEKDNSFIKDDLLCDKPATLQTCTIKCNMKKKEKCCVNYHEIRKQVKAVCKKKRQEKRKCEKTMKKILAKFQCLEKRKRHDFAKNIKTMKKETKKCVREQQKRLKQWECCERQKEKKRRAQEKCRLKKLKKQLQLKCRNTYNIDLKCNCDDPKCKAKCEKYLCRKFKKKKISFHKSSHLNVPRDSNISQHQPRSIFLQNKLSRSRSSHFGSVSFADICNQPLDTTQCPQPIDCCHTKQTQKRSNTKVANCHNRKYRGASYSSICKQPMNPIKCPVPTDCCGEYEVNKCQNRRRTSGHHRPNSHCKKITSNQSSHHRPNSRCKKITSNQSSHHRPNSRCKKITSNQSSHHRPNSRCKKITSNQSSHHLPNSRSEKTKSTQNMNKCTGKLKKLKSRYEKMKLKKV